MEEYRESRDHLEIDLPVCSDADDFDKRGVQFETTTSQFRRFTGNRQVVSATIQACFRIHFRNASEHFGKYSGPTTQITGMLFLDDGRVVVVDQLNNRLQLYSGGYSFLNEVVVCGVFDITNIGNSTVAVTSTSLKCVNIYFISIDNKIILQRVIKLQETCFGISFAKETFAVVCCDKIKSLKLLTMTGEEKKVVNFSQVLTGTSYSPYVTVSQKSNKIFLSDTPYTRTPGTETRPGRVKCLSPDGNLKWERSYNSSYGIAVVGSNVLIADSVNHRILLLTTQGQMVKTLVDSNNGLRSPMTLSVSASGDKLLVSDKTDIIRIFNLNFSLFPSFTKMYRNLRALTDGPGREIRFN